MVGQFVSIWVSAKFERVTTWSIPNRLSDAFEEHGMTVVKSPVIQLATAEHEVELKELRNERAAAQTDVANKEM